MAARNEDWILGLSARVALMWCDAIVILDHASTDNTKFICHHIAAEHPGRVALLNEVHGEWDEMRHRQRMLDKAREMGATHVAIVDADEVLSANLLQINMFGQGALMDRHSGIPAESILQLPGYNMRGSISRYHASGVWGHRWFSVAFADAPQLGWSGDKFHSRDPGKLNPYCPIAQGNGGVMHLWGASERRLRAKHAHYQIVEALRWPEKSRDQIRRMYSLWRSPQDTPGGGLWTYETAPSSWWEPYAHLLRYLDVNAEPWQERAVCEAVAKHGAERFAGLDLFGIA